MTTITTKEFISEDGNKVIHTETDYGDGRKTISTRTIYATGKAPVQAPPAAAPAPTPYYQTPAPQEQVAPQKMSQQTTTSHQISPQVTRPTQTAADATRADAMGNLILRAVNDENHHYQLTTLGAPNQYHIEFGDLCSNILCGCFLQYYAFDIILMVNTNQIHVISTVPCGGCWGGMIGVSKNRSETQRIKSALPNAFPAYQVL